MSMLSAAIVHARANHTASVILLHGLGGSGHGLEPVAQILSQSLPHVKFILPHAPAQAVTVNGGMRMPSWYDIMSLDKIASVEDEAGMNASMMRINELIRNEVDAGIPADRIVVGGFSQGAALSLFTVLQSERKFAGLVVLSGYLPVRDRLVPRITDASKRVPVFQAHGTADEVVLYQYGEMTSEVLKKNGFDAVFKAYQHMDHSTCNDEIRDMQQFLAKQIPEQS